MLQQWCTVLAKEGGTSLLGRGRELGGISERENCHEKLWRWQWKKGKQGENGAFNSLILAWRIETNFSLIKPAGQEKRWGTPRNCLSLFRGCAVCLAVGWEKLSTFADISLVWGVYLFIKFGFCFPACLFRNASGGYVVMSKLWAPLSFESCFVNSTNMPFAFTGTWCMYSVLFPSPPVLVSCKIWLDSTLEAAAFPCGQSCLSWVRALGAVAVKAK